MTAQSDRIKRLLEDEDLKGAFENVRNKLLDAFTHCKTDDADLMVDIRKRLHLLDAVEQSLYNAIRDGELEDFRASEQQKPPFLGDMSLWRRSNKA